MIEGLLAKAPLITDGAWGTQLAAGGAPDELNLTAPERVEAVARAYVEAGSDIILTNTFRANRIALAGYGLADKVHDINRRGAEISRAAASDKALVFASVGPTGKLLAAEEIDEGAVRDAFTEQVEALAEGGAQGIVLETFSDIAEAEIAAEAVKQLGLIAVASMVFDSGSKRDRTMTGVTPERAARGLDAADVIGANCGVGIEAYVPICARLRAATSKPIWIKPNAGLPEIVARTPVYRQTVNEFAAFLPALIEAGASVIGGCCGTTPGHVRALRALVKTQCA